MYFTTTQGGLCFFLISTRMLASNGVARIRVHIFFQQISVKYAKECQVSYLVAVTLLIKHQALPKMFISAIMV